MIIKNLSTCQQFILRNPSLQFTNYAKRLQYIKWMNQLASNVLLLQTCRGRGQDGVDWVHLTRDHWLVNYCWGLMSTAVIREFLQQLNYFFFATSIDSVSWNQLICGLDEITNDFNVRHTVVLFVIINGTSAQLY